MNINKIKSNVAEWFSNYGSDYGSVFEAINDTGNAHVSELISAFTNIN